MFFQAVESQLTAVGGFYTAAKGRKIYPGLAVTSWSVETGWQRWREEGRQEGGERSSSFMYCQVPLSWIENVCRV